jgi:hypothetical protein
MVTQIPYSDKDHPQHRLSSNTVLAGANQGWRFSIPLQNRSGNGYVFNSNLVKNQDSIADEFSKELDINKQDFRVIKWNPGRYENPVVGNCLALGLAQGFTDPFDANNLSLTVKLVTELVSLLGNKDFSMSYMSDILNQRSSAWWHDIDIRVESCLRLSPRRDTEHYRMIAEYAEKSRLQERFVEHIVSSRNRDCNHSHTYLWKPWTHTILAARYGIALPGTEYTAELEEMCKHYFEFNKFKYKLMSDRAPTLNDYYLSANK